MIGDFILWLRKTLKQQTCIHDYQSVYVIGAGMGYDECKKCGKVK